MPKAGESPSIAKPLLVMLALMAAISATGLQLYRIDDRETREDAQNLVTAVVRQKAQTLDIWLEQQSAQADSYQYALGFRADVAQLVAKHDASSVFRIRERLAVERWPGDAVLLLDVRGAPLVSTGQLGGVSAELRDRVHVAVATRTAQPHFLHRDEDLAGSPVFLDYLVPLTAPGSTGKPIAVLVLRHDPEKFFFPLIQTWPAPSRSAETLLVRREVSQVLFLNTLRHQADTAFRLTRPSSEATLPAAQVLFGLPRLESNFDYRGIDVVYDHRPVAGTEWHMVSKIDAAEILHSVRDAGAAALAVTLALIVMVGASAVVYWRQQLRMFAANRHAAELEREALSKHLDLMSRYANDAIFLYDDAGRILQANERAVERYGYPRDELIGMSASQLRAPGVAREARAEVQRAEEAGSGIYETLHRRKDGSEFPVEASLNVVSLEGRRLTQGIIRDITERKRIQDAMQRESDFISAALDSLPGLFYVIDDQGRFLRWNKNFEILSGYSSEEVSRLSPTDLFADAEKEIIADRIRQVFLTGEATVEADFVAKDQTKTPYFFTGRLVRIDQKPCLIGMGIDITVRRQAERALARQKDLYNALSLTNQTIVRGTSREELFQAVCRIAVERGHFMFAWVGLIDQDDQDVKLVARYGEDAGYLSQLHMSVDQPGSPGRSVTGQALLAGGHGVSNDFLNDPLTAEWHDSGQRAGVRAFAVFPIRQSGAVVGAISVYAGEPGFFTDDLLATLDEMAMDVSFALDNLDRERELRAAEEQFRGLVEQSISGICIIQDGRYAYANPRAVEIFGCRTPDEMIGRSSTEFVAEKDRALVAENIRRRVAGEAKSIAYTFTGVRKDGTTVEVGAHGTLATYRGRPAIIGVVQDITQRKLAEEEIQRHVEELERAMMATVRVASTIGEMRDPYTSGHERRVGELTAAIGAEVGLSEHQVEGLRVAGYLHDLGKITVPTEILAKPGKISAVEFSLIKEHARQGYEILKEVSFPWPVALVALQHHERLDGSGYPKGLKGDEIIFEARILAVADTVEAMSSHRPYRPGFGIEAALAEIEQHRGTQYDPQAVDACLRLFRDKGYQLPA